MHVVARISRTAVLLSFINKTADERSRASAFQPAKHGGDRKGFGGATYVMEKRSKAELERLGMDAQPPALIDMVLCDKNCEISVRVY